MNPHTSLVVKDEFVLNEARKIARREGKDFSEWTFDLYKKEIRVHGEGNPIYRLDKFMDPNFKAVPAFMENLKLVWIPYFQKRNDKELEEIIEQSEQILNYAAAYRSTNKYERPNIWFGTQRDARARAGI